MAEFRVLGGATVTISEETVIGEDVTIFPNNVIEGESDIARGATIYPNNIVKDSKIGAGAQITASVIEQASVGSRSTVGPFAHLRPKATVGEGCRIGNFVEIKNASIGDGTKVGHLTYIGDATVGKDCNIGCGVVFCNYDGQKKHRTVIGDRCFIGSNVNLVAPIKIGDGCFIAAGTTVTQDVPPGSFVIGRSKQQVRADRRKTAPPPISESNGGCETPPSAPSDCACGCKSSPSAPSDCACEQGKMSRKE